MSSIFQHTRTLVIVALAGLVAGCSGDETQESSPVLAPLVEAVPARSGALPVEVTVPGVVRAHNQVAIRPEVEGRVVEVLVRSGEAVERGQILVRLDQGEARERLRQAEANVRLAEAAAAASRARVVELESRVDRTRSLATEELISQQELETLEAQLDALRASTDEATARVEQSKATVEERRSALAKTEVRAPVAGRLGDRRAEVGMLVDSGDILFLIGDLDELIVEVNLTEAMLATVEEGLPVEITSRSANGEPTRAELSRISPFLAEDSFTTLAEIDVDNRAGALRPGMFATVRILVGQSQQATLIPVSALWEDPETGRRGVFVVQGSGTLTESDTAYPVRFQEVQVLAEGRGAAGVGGIDEGAWVVTVGQHLLSSELRSASRLAGDAEGRSANETPARIRPVTWQHVLELRGLQDEDLLEGFLDKQRLVAAALGADIPASEDEVDRVLEEAAARQQDPVER